GADVAHHLFLDTRTTIELAHQRSEVEHFKKARRQIIRSLRCFKCRSWAKRECQRNVSRSLIGRSRGCRQQIAFIKDSQSFAELRIKIGHLLPDHRTES